MGVPGGACELVMDVCNFHFMVKKVFTKVIIFELRPDAVNLADRKPEVLSRGNNKGPGEECA